MELYYFKIYFVYIRLGLWCLMALSTIYHLYRGVQFYWWRKPVSGESLKSMTNFITYLYRYLHKKSLNIRVITKLPNSEPSYKGKVKTHKYINRQNQSITGKL